MTTLSNNLEDRMRTNNNRKQLAVALSFGFLALGSSAVFAAPPDAKLQTEAERIDLLIASAVGGGGPFPFSFSSTSSPGEGSGPSGSTNSGGGTRRMGTPRFLRNST